MSVNDDADYMEGRIIALEAAVARMLPLMPSEWWPQFRDELME